MKYVLMTGAYGGIGKSVLKLLSENWYTVFALDREVGEVEENIIPIQVDFEDKDSFNCAFDKVKQTTNQLCAIIHFAGIYMLDSLIELSESEVEKIFKINFFGAVDINKKFFSLLVKGSKIIITTSEHAPLVPLPFTGIYAQKSF